MEGLKWKPFMFSGRGGRCRGWKTRAAGLVLNPRRHPFPVASKSATKATDTASRQDGARNPPVAEAHEQEPAESPSQLPVSLRRDDGLPPLATRLIRRESILGPAVTDVSFLFALDFNRTPSRGEFGIFEKKVPSLQKLGPLLINFHELHCSNSL